MSVNIGHGDRRVIDAITAQATKLQFVQPAFATEIRARLGAKLAEILPGDMDKVFFTLGGAEAIENAIKLARHATGRHKILARYRSYHGATLGRDDADRRPAPLGERAGPRRRRPLPGHAPLGRGGAAARGREPAGPRGRHPLRGREDRSRRSSSRPIVGTNGILIPPDGYIAGVREICDRNDILMVADEVMAGFGRTGRWFAVDHWGVDPGPDDDGQGPDQLVPAARRGRHAPRHRREVRDPDVLRRPDLQQPPGQPRGVAGHDRRLRGGRPDRATPPASTRSCASTTGASRRKHPSVGATRNLGLFGIIDLVRSRDPWTPLTPFNGTSDEMKAIGKFLRENGPVHDARQQLDPHQPAAVHHRGPAGRGLRDHRPRARHRRPGGRPDAGGRSDGRRDDRPPARSLGVRPVGRRWRSRSTPVDAPARRRRRPRPGRRCWSSGRAPSGSAAIRGGSTARSPGIQIDYEHVPPLEWRIADDLVAAARLGSSRRAFVDPAQRGGAAARRRADRRRPLFTFLEALAGFALGGAARSRPRRSCSSTRGLPSAPRAVRRRLARPSRSSPSRRSSWSRIKADWLSVMAVVGLPDVLPGHDRLAARPARGDPRAFELLRSYAATRRQILWQLRLPTSVPYLFAGVPGRRRGGASSARSSGSRPRASRPGSAARSSTSTSTTSRRPSACGRRS